LSTGERDLSVGLLPQNNYFNRGLIQHNAKATIYNILVIAFGFFVFLQTDLLCISRAHSCAVIIAELRPLSPTLLSRDNNNNNATPLRSKRQASTGRRLEMVFLLGLIVG